MSWHFAFVTDGIKFSVYEVYGLDMRTTEPVGTFTGEDTLDAIHGLRLMIKDLEKGRVFSSIKELDEHYGIEGGSGDD